MRNGFGACFRAPETLPPYQMHKLMMEKTAMPCDVTPDVAAVTSDPTVSGLMSLHRLVYATCLHPSDGPRNRVGQRATSPTYECRIVSSWKLIKYPVSVLLQPTHQTLQRGGLDPQEKIPEVAADTLYQFDRSEGPI